MPSYELFEPDTRFHGLAGSGHQFQVPPPDDFANQHPPGTGPIGHNGDLDNPTLGIPGNSPCGTNFDISVPQYYEFLYANSIALPQVMPDMEFPPPYSVGIAAIAEPYIAQSHPGAALDVNRTIHLLQPGLVSPVRGLPVPPPSGARMICAVTSASTTPRGARTAAPSLSAGGAL
ncbi:MAG: hypothetical protein M1813_007934 [Trichoglossum hirsutum]|nr:MAG: hypothetical protein M1813_007934 [Trichoglossum hirsutum]